MLVDFGVGVALWVIRVNVCSPFEILHTTLDSLVFWIRVFKSISDSSFDSEAMSAHVFLGSFVRSISWKAKSVSIGKA